MGVSPLGGCCASGYHLVEYIIYVTDLSSLDLYSWRLHCYTDDVQCYSSSHPDHSNITVRELNKNLKTISDSSQKNGLTLNFRKTRVLQIGARSCLALVSPLPRDSSVPLVQLDNEASKIKDCICVLPLTVFSVLKACY